MNETQDKVRVEILQCVQIRSLTVSQAAQLLGCSPRQVFRWLRRLREKGPSDLLGINAHRRRPRKLLPEQAIRILELVQTRYPKANDTELAETLRQTEKLEISRESLRRLLRGAGIPPKRRRRCFRPAPPNPCMAKGTGLVEEHSLDWSQAT